MTPLASFPTPFRNVVGALHADEPAWRPWEAVDLIADLGEREPPIGFRSRPPVIEPWPPLLKRISYWSCTCTRARSASTCGRPRSSNGSWLTQACPTTLVPPLLTSICYDHIEALVDPSASSTRRERATGADL